jgi:hypothetical protein
VIYTGGGALHQQLESVVVALVARGERILAADETIPTLTKPFDTARDPLDLADPPQLSPDALFPNGGGRVHQRSIMQPGSIHQESSA